MLKNTLLVLTIILAVVNIYIIATNGFYERRLIRFISIVAIFLVFLIFKGYKDKHILIAFLFLIIVDALGIFYEKGLIALIGPVIKLLAYTTLVLSVYKKVAFKKINIKTSVVPTIIILLNLFLIYTVVSAVFSNQNEFKETILYVVYGSTIIGAAILAVNYNFRYGSKRSMYFLYFVFALILSDAAWFIAYYLKTNTAFYFDTVYYLIALGVMVYYAVATKSSDDKLSELAS